MLIILPLFCFSSVRRPPPWPTRCRARSHSASLPTFGSHGQEWLDGRKAAQFTGTSNWPDFHSPFHHVVRQAHSEIQRQPG